MEYANDSADANKLNAIYAANPELLNLPAGAADANARNCSTSSPVDFLYLHTIRGGRKMSELSGTISSGSMSGGCGCSGKSGMSGGGGGYTGGCFTCPKGVKNIVLIYGTFQNTIPAFYKKYKAAKAMPKAMPKAKKAIKKK